MSELTTANRDSTRAVTNRGQLIFEGGYYRKSRNFRVENISWGKFSCKIIFVGGDPLPYALAL